MIRLCKSENINLGTNFQVDVTCEVYKNSSDLLTVHHRKSGFSPPEVDCSPQEVDCSPQEVRISPPEVIECKSTLNGLTLFNPV